MPDVSNSPQADLRVAVAGLGPIGMRVVEELDRGIDGLRLTAVAGQNPAKHTDRRGKGANPPATRPVEELADAADIVVECAPSKLVRAIVAPSVTSGKT